MAHHRSTHQASAPHRALLPPRVALVALLRVLARAGTESPSAELTGIVVQAQRALVYGASPQDIAGIFAAAERALRQDGLAAWAADVRQLRPTPLGAPAALAEAALLLLAKWPDLLRHDEALLVQGRLLRRLRDAESAGDASLPHVLAAVSACHALCSSRRAPLRQARQLLARAWREPAQTDNSLRRLQRLQASGIKTHDDTLRPALNRAVGHLVVAEAEQRFVRRLGPRQLGALAAATDAGWSIEQLRARWVAIAQLSAWSSNASAKQWARVRQMLAHSANDTPAKGRVGVDRLCRRLSAAERRQLAAVAANAQLGPDAFRATLARFPLVPKERLVAYSLLAHAGAAWLNAVGAQGQQSARKALRQARRALRAADTWAPLEASLAQVLQACVHSSHAQMPHGKLAAALARLEPAAGATEPSAILAEAIGYRSRLRAR